MYRVTYRLPRLSNVFIRHWDSVAEANAYARGITDMGGAVLAIERR